MSNSTNFDRLYDAGLIKDGYQFSEEELAAIETLSEQEVAALISAAHKLRPRYEHVGAGPIDGMIL
jgi:hypothetical protein